MKHFQIGEEIVRMVRKTTLRRSLLFMAVAGAIGMNARSVEPVGEVEVATNYVEEDGQMVIPPLFEYVMAPDDLPDLRSRTDYLMEHFWDPFDFKKTNIVDQNALNHAFWVYTQAMPYASEKKVDESVKNLIKKIRNNPGLSYQFAKAAEENLYGPRAELWGDAVFIEFLQNVVDNRKVRESQKKHFRDQLELLRRTAAGSPLPELSVTDLAGNSVKLIPGKEFTLVEFTTPANEDGPYSNLKLDISGVVNDLIEDGRLEVDIIVIDDKAPEGALPDKWNIFYSPEAASGMDLRINPSFFVIGKDKKIVGKNLPVDDAIQLLEALSKQK